MSPTIQGVVGEVSRALRALYGDRLTHLVLFGSQARGDAAPDSDIDLLVVLKSPVRPGQEISRVGKTTAALSLKHDVVISCTFISAERYAAEETPLLLNVRREGVPV